MEHRLQGDPSLIWSLSEFNTVLSSIKISQRNGPVNGNRIGRVQRGISGRRPNERTTMRGMFPRPEDALR